MNSTGLPGNLPIPPGGTSGTLTITRASLLDGVSGRTYVIVITTSGGSGTLSSCSITSGALPTGLAASVDPANSTRCRISGTIGAPAPVATPSFTLQAADTSVPAQTASQVFTLRVRQEFAITNIAAFLDGVQGRTYGNAPQTPQPVNTNVSATIGNAPLVSCTFTIAGNPGFNLTPAPSGTACPLSSGATVLGAAGAFNVALTATDTPITDPLNGNAVVVPAGSVSNSAAPLALRVRAPISFSLNAAVLSAGGVIPDGVIGRTYGAPLTNLIFTATGGLATSAGLTGTVGGTFTANNVGCAPTTAQVGANAVVTCSSQPGGTGVLSGATGARSLTMTFADAGNAAVPAGSMSTDAAGNSAYANNVLAALAVGFNQAGNTNPASTLLDGMNGRSYGVINTNAGAPTYTASGGLGAGAAGAGTYRWCVSAGGAQVTGIGLSGISTNCAAPTTGGTGTVFLSSASAVSGSAGFTVQLDDTANATTPAGAATAGSSTINVLATVLGLQLAQGATLNPATLLDAVSGRSYATGGQAAFAPTYTASGGLATGTAGVAAYRWCVSAGAIPSGFSESPAGANTACTAPASTSSATETVTSASAGTAGGPNAFTIQVDDTGNAATPSASVTSATQITIQAALSFTLAPVPGAGGSIPDAVIGRTYGTPLANLVFTASGGLATTAGLTTAATGTLFTAATNFACAPLGLQAAGSPVTVTCNSGGAAVTGAATPNTTLVFTISDAGNSAVPVGSTSTDTLGNSSYLNSVHAALVIALVQNGTPLTGGAPAVLLPGVNGRSYGSGAQLAAAADYSVTGGLAGSAGANYRWCVSTLPATYPGGFTAVGNTCGATSTTTGSALSVNSANVTAAAATYTFTIQVDDAGNAMVPASATVVGQSSSQSTQVVINGPLTIALVQNGTPLTGGAPAVLLPGVNGRLYGSGAFLGAAADYSVTGGLSGTAGANYRWCVSTLPATYPSGFTAVGNTCGTASTTTGSAVTVNSAGVTAAAATYTFTIQADDAGNAAVPDSVTSATSSPQSTQVVIHGPLAITLTQTGNATPTNPATLIDGVNGRSYAQAVGKTAAAPTYSITAGTGLGAGPYTWCVQVGAPGGLTGVATCPATTTGNTVSLSSASATTVAPTSFTVQVDEPASAAVPGSSASATTPTNTTSFQVHAALAIALMQNSVNLTGGAPAVLISGVTGRTYAEGAQTATGAVLYTGSGGLGSALFRWCISAGAVPAGFADATAGAVSATCTAAGSTTATAITLRGNPVTAAAATYNFTMDLGDAGNAAVQDAFTAATTSTQATRVVIDPDISVVSVAPDPAAATSAAVIGRQYGAPGGRTSPVYTFTGGLPAYTITTPTLPAWMTCATGATTLTCQSGPGATTVSAGPSTVVVNVTDTANAATPAIAAPFTDTRAITVNLALSIGVVPDPNLNPAVSGRGYGTPAGMTSPVYTAAGSLGGYTMSTAGSLPTGFNAPTINNAAGTVTVGAANVTGTTTNTFAVSVTDTQNNTTPAGAFNRPADTYTVNAALTITTTQAQVPNGLENYTYNPTVPGVNLAATGGIGALTWLGPGVATASCALRTGTIPTGLALGPASGALTGMPTAASSSAGFFTFQICAEDTASATTPAGGSGNSSFIIDVMRPLAYLAVPTNAPNDTVDVIATSGDTATPNLFVSSVNFTNPDNPEDVAITPDGRKAFVTLLGTNSFAVIDTITNAIWVGPPSGATAALSTCTGPRGIAIGTGTNSSGKAYVACGNRQVAVINTTTFAVTIISPVGSVGAAFDSVAIPAGGDKVYLTDFANGEVDIIDTAAANAVTTVALGVGCTLPHGIAFAGNGARYYIACNGTKNVQIRDAATNGATLLSNISTGANSLPEQVAVDNPSATTGGKVFITLQGVGGPPAEGFMVIDDSAAPAQNASSPVTTATSTVVPVGVTIPPLLTAPLKVYFSNFGAGNATIHDDTGAFPLSVGSPVSLSSVSAQPRRIAHIPVPK